MDIATDFFRPAIVPTRHSAELGEQLDLLSGLDSDDAAGAYEQLGPSSILLRRFALSTANELMAAVRVVKDRSPLRHMTTASGFRMSVALSSCGELGWITDRHGPRYTDIDPMTERAWPAMPRLLIEVARSAAAQAGCEDFLPDTCLISRHLAGARMSPRQDKDLSHPDSPVVSISLGMSALFRFGGNARSDRAHTWVLHHGDVVVLGGADRTRHHGVSSLNGDPHPALGNQRVNLTFRRVG